ncbi:hypothetical protein [Frigoriglobus tundricola]|uniref:Uncharacterized protein n=1 Tax=Frigoriglobus tundricola TaxID=2774151 RepID=A0A6M5YZG5_9BACT|nr:hypothetical protein [Frigoriglobus tundricola]QJW99345.1 hypothetical protein FTUN_6953 [Frigoriglobus tundricola]
MAPHLRTPGRIPIGSGRAPTELPWRWRGPSPLATLGPDRLAALAGVRCAGELAFPPAD